VDAINPPYDNKVKESRLQGVKRIIIYFISLPLIMIAGAWLMRSLSNDYKLYSAIAGALIGLVVGITLIRLSVKRNRKQYEIDSAGCVACGRCFGYCPQNNNMSEPQFLQDE
jgi:NAD-dependent dihydropyrimidine dehydrogenase PreA subunit